MKSIKSRNFQLLLQSGILLLKFFYQNITIRQHLLQFINHFGLRL